MKTISIIVFGLSTCIYTKKALELLKTRKISFKYYSIDNYYNLFFKILLEISKQYPNYKINNLHKTVPVIFYKKKFFGGYKELFIKNNK